MEKIILTIIRALGTMGETGVHWFLGWVEDVCANTPNLIDNELFYKALAWIKTYEPKNPPTE